MNDRKHIINIKVILTISKVSSIKYEKITKGMVTTLLFKMGVECRN